MTSPNTPRYRSLPFLYLIGVRSRQNAISNMLAGFKAAMVMSLFAISLSAMGQVTQLVVTTTADSNDGACSTVCSLRDAITAANAATPASISFASGVKGTITLSSALPEIQDTLTITGPSAASLTVSGNNSSSIGSVFVIGSSAVVTIANLTIANGNAGTNYGGGIISYGNLTLNGITFYGNAAPYGSAVSNSSVLTVNNSTFSANAASSYGAIVNYGTTVVNSSTFSGNTGGSGLPAFVDYGTSLTVRNSLLADGVAECYSSNNGCPVSGASGNLILPSSATLEPLGNYGGPTQTFLPLPGSTAICAATPSLATAAGLTIDQRGFPRTNTTYTGYTGGTPCVDAGAVQTHYTSVAFVTQPSSSSMNTTISPAPTVEVLETNSNLAGPSNTNSIAGIPITLTFTGTGTLSGTTTATTAGGTQQVSGLISGAVASFTNLSVNANGTGDTLSTSLTVTPSGTAGVTTLSITSNPFNIQAAVAINVSVGTTPTGLGFAVDGVAYTATDVATWEQNSQHTLTTTSPQMLGGVEYVFSSWSDGTTNLTDTVTVPVSASSETYTANFVLAYPSTSADNVWVVNANGVRSELSDAGVPETLGVGTSGTSGTFGSVAFDSTGNVWSVTNQSNALSFNSKTGGATTTYSGGGLNAPVSVVVDGNGYIWIANAGNGSVSEFSNSGVALSGTSGFGPSEPLGAGPSSIAIDNTGGIWVASKTGNSISHIYGVAAPVKTPTAAAVSNSSVGVKP